VSYQKLLKNYVLNQLHRRWALGKCGVPGKVEMGVRNVRSQGLNGGQAVALWG